VTTLMLYSYQNKLVIELLFFRVLVVYYITSEGKCNSKRDPVERKLTRYSQGVAILN
jgi:hypothetical protein